jgi:hypothetical protein
MTIVKQANFDAEEFTYCILRGYSLYQLQEEFQNIFPKQTIISYYNSIISFLNSFDGNMFQNNFTDPSTETFTRWYDIEDENYGINVKYAYQSSANSRIRDITKEAVQAINEFIIENNILPADELFDYPTFRNIILHNIGYQVKNRLYPIKITFHEDIYIKLAYLVCLDFVGRIANERNIIFFLYGKDEGVSFFVPRTNSESKINYRNFLNDARIICSTNDEDCPHKKTIRFFVNDFPIGFFEVRSNNRVMLHLRHSENHWDNLLNYIN